jgi:hypothetical protein
MEGWLPYTVTFDRVRNYVVACATYARPNIQHSAVIMSPDEKENKCGAEPTLARFPYMFPSVLQLCQPTAGRNTSQDCAVQNHF